MTKQIEAIPACFAVVMESGLVHSVVSDTALPDLNVLVINSDTEVYNPERLVSVPQTDGSSAVVKAANAAAVIFAHNHPSGLTEPSAADRQITARLKAALNLVDIRVLDHFVVGADEIYSLAEHGIL